MDFVLSNLVNSEIYSIYILVQYRSESQLLRQALRQAREQGQRDFGRDVLPRLVDTHRVYAYDFAANQVPGVRAYEEQGYGRDVGTLDAYYEATMDTLVERIGQSALNRSDLRRDYPQFEMG